MNKRNKRKARLPVEAYHIYVEGETERAYFNGVKEYLGSKIKDKISLKIYPNLKSSDICSDKKKENSIVNELKKHKEENPGCDLFLLVDYDVVLKSRNCVEKIEKIKHLSNSGIKLLKNSPCFEIWILSHFKHPNNFYSTCNDVIKDLKKCYPGFEKKTTVYKGLYNNLRQRLSDAIKHSKQLEQNKSESQAEIYKIIEKLNS